MNGSVGLWRGVKGGSRPMERCERVSRPMVRCEVGQWAYGEV